LSLFRKTSCFINFFPSDSGRNKASTAIAPYIEPYVWNFMGDESAVSNFGSSSLATALDSSLKEIPCYAAN